MIERIIEADNGVFWIQTGFGLDRFDTRRRTVKTFREFHHVNRMARSPENDLLVLKDDGYVWHYRPDEGEFYPLEMERLHPERVQHMAIDHYGVLWIFSSDHDNRRYRLTREEGRLRLVPDSPLNHAEDILWAFVDGDAMYFIDRTYSFYECELGKLRCYYIADLEKEIRARGEVSDIVKSGNDYLIGFKSSGLLQLKYVPDSKVKYVTHSVSTQPGVFCLMKDRFQDIVWVGTDGQGLHMYFTDEVSIRSVPLDVPEYRVNTPVRALFWDEERTLWIGTKGGGILRMPGFRPDMETLPKAEKITAADSELADNSVYSFAPGHGQRLWIGTENGLCYYSYAARKVRDFPVMAGGKPVRYVHSIHEVNDSTLWLVSVSEGIVRIVFDAPSPDGSPRVSHAERFVLDGGKRKSNYFWTAFRENDSIIWFGNRGYGAYRMNTQTCQLKPYRIEGIPQSKVTNDIFAISKTADGYWFGTGGGLARLHQGEWQLYDEADGFPNNTIHGILEGEEGHLWLSTNQGMVRFDVRRNTLRAYRRRGDSEVTEFSDGAFYKDSITGTLFFGGTNGFVTINEHAGDREDYMPPLSFDRLSIFGRECNLYDLLQGDSREVLTLDYSQNFFSLSFSAIDYINGNNYTYSYKMAGLSDSWIENGFSTTAVFSNLSPGDYTLWVKYRSNVTGRESDPYALRIRIVPPFYMTAYAYVAYFLLFVVLVLLAVRAVKARYRRKRDAMMAQMNQKQREEVYESKLRFFTNITHEFCTPLTLINGPCEKILSCPQVDGYVRKYASMIQQNALKLNALILELIEFRRLETGHRTLTVRRVAVTEQVRSIAESFGELSESLGVDYRLRLQDDVSWNTDTSCLSKIVTNLISNAFKYTPAGGTVTVSLSADGECLRLRVANTGKGIKAEDLSKIFDRYKVLDNFEVQDKRGVSPRNGLGLAICHSMVTLLNGHIDVTSVPGEETAFEVRLPEMELTADAAPDAPCAVDDSPMPPSSLSADEQGGQELRNTPSEWDKEKRTLMIIDDDPSMLWFVTEIFVGRYNVIPLSSAEEALQRLKEQVPDLIISDVMMPGMDGMSFARRLKSDKRLGHIPLILLSALNDIDEQAKGIESGAETYITKPFNVEYLEKVVQRLMQRERDLKEYYSSIRNAFELEDGRLLHKDDRRFLEEVMQAIDSHIEDPELSSEMLGSRFGYSARQFSRKVKALTDKSPSDIIREYRLNVVEHLLVTTRLSVDEIMDKTGYVNRSTFYRAFAHRFGMTPGQYREAKIKEVQAAEDGQATEGGETTPTAE